MRGIILVVALIALIGGGVGGWMIYTDKHEKAVAAAAADPVIVQFDTPTYVQLSPIMVPIFDAQKGAREIVTLVLSIEVNDAVSETLVLNNRVRLTDAFIRDMYGSLDKTQMINQAGLLNVEMISVRLNRVSRQVLGNDVRTTVMLQAFQQRPV